MLYLQTGNIETFRTCTALARVDGNAVLDALADISARAASGTFLDGNALAALTGGSGASGNNASLQAVLDELLSNPDLPGGDILAMVPAAGGAGSVFSIAGSGTTSAGGAGPTVALAGSGATPGSDGGLLNLTGSASPSGGATPLLDVNASGGNPENIDSGPLAHASGSGDNLALSDDSTSVDATIGSGSGEPMIDVNGAANGGGSGTGATSLIDSLDAGVSRLLP
jgi:hypothetical protein